MNEFQYRLQKAIAEKNISASELSRRSGVGKSDISNYINGVYVAKQDKCFMLARALDVDPGWLMTGEEPRKLHLQGEISVPFDDSLLDIIESRMTQEDIELEDLWPTASVTARRAALAVLRSMKEGGS